MKGEDIKMPVINNIKIKTKYGFQEADLGAAADNVTIKIAGVEDPKSLQEAYEDGDLGGGGVAKVNGKSPDSNGNVTLTPADVNALPTVIAGVPNGVATLDSYGHLWPEQIPGTIAKVEEYATYSDFPSNPTEEEYKNTMYVALDTNKVYRYGGTTYVEISSSLALGETSTTAYRGDRGKTAYNHATDSSRLTTAKTSGLYKIATTAEGHIASTTAVAKSDITELGIPASDTTYDAITTSELLAGTSTTKRTVRADYIRSGIEALTPHYGTCNTAANVDVKEVYISDTNWKLRVGAIIAVKFTYLNTASTTYLQVNGNADSKGRIYYNTGLTDGWAAGEANRITSYMWDGTQWIWLSHSVDNNTIYTPQELGFGYGICNTAAATVAKVVTLANYTLVKNGIISVKFNYAVPANATMNINSKGAKNIFYRGGNLTAGVIEAGDTATFIYDGTQYHLLTTDKPKAFFDGNTLKINPY